MFGGQLSAGGRLTWHEMGRTSLTAELKEFDLRQVPAGKDFPALPAGRASVRMIASYPGLKWDRSQVKASAAVRLNPGGRVAESSTITGELDGRLEDRRLRVHIGSISGHGAKMQGSLVLDTGKMSLAGELTGTVRSASELIHALESDLRRPADSLLPFAVDGALESRVTLSGSIREPGASVELTGTGMSAGRMEGARLQARGEYAGRVFRVEQARLDWRNQTATATGEFGLDSGSALRFEAGTENAAIADILEGLRLNVDVHATADARVSGDRYRRGARMHLRLDARDVSVYGEPLGNLSSEADWHGGTLEVSRLRTELPRDAGMSTLKAGVPAISTLEPTNSASPPKTCARQVSASRATPPCRAPCN